MHWSPSYGMGFLDKLGRKKDEVAKDDKENTKGGKTHPEKRIKRYTSEGQPVHD
ncbi:MAG TPA: hypothetical protein VGJ42_03805 [Nitrososphaera sp.]|jgi:hypothetical protein